MTGFLNVHLASVRGNICKEAKGGIRDTLRKLLRDFRQEFLEAQTGDENRGDEGWLDETSVSESNGFSEGSEVGCT